MSCPLPPWRPTIITLVVVALGFNLPSAVAASRVLVIRRGPCEYEAALRHLGVSFRTASDQRALSALRPGSTDSVLLCALRYPLPNVLAPQEQRALESFVRAGGNALVELSTSRGGNLFGVALAAEPKRAFFERLYVVGPHPVTDSLGEGALLEEHNSAYLPCVLPPAATRLLDYGKVLGTYRVFRRDPGVEVVLDLGRPCHVRRVVQRYGAGEPNYCPERVRIATSPDGITWQERHSACGAPLLGDAVDVPLDAPDTRYVRCRVVKYRRSRVTDFLFIGETQVFDASGRNVAEGKRYRLSPPPAADYSDTGWLTDGVDEGHWSLHRAPGWVVPEPPSDATMPGLVEMPYGRGRVLLALTKVSDFRARHYRLTSRWEELLRQMVLRVLPAPAREEAMARYVPLEAHTEPRRWQTPGGSVRLVVATAPGARVTVRAPGLRVPAPHAVGGGRFETEFTAPAGTYRLRVRSVLSGHARELVVPLDVSPRRERYRQALRSSLNWFRRSGVLPAPDGTGGVYSQRCIAWFDGAPWDGGPTDYLPSPQRLDCNAAAAVAFWLFGEATGDPSCFTVARNIADSLLRHQYADATRASFGGWPWLREHSDTIWFWDDNTRVAVALLWLYTKSGDARYLEAGLRTMELCRQVALEDGCIARHAIEPADLDRIGRSGFKTLRQAIAVDFDLLRLGWAAEVTGDPVYLELLRTCARTRGHQAGPRGLPYAVHLLGDAALRERLVSTWRGYLQDPDIRRYGAPRAPGGDFQHAFTNDCGIATENGEPLTDQLYTVPHLLLHAWAAYQATGESCCREAFERLGDYLVRIQSEDPDPRLHGAWVRGFDVNAWEEYGANYDPAYGPYSAYTGWMNAFAAIGLALYLTDQPPFPNGPGNLEQVRSLLRRVRAQQPDERVRSENIALGRPYTVVPAPEPGYADSGTELTDGVVDGLYDDGLSVGWHLGEGETLEVTITVDLGSVRPLAQVAQRYGATVATYTPDTIELLTSVDGERFERVAETRFGPSPVGSLWLQLPEGTRGRFIRFRLKKTRQGGGDDFLFVGETMAFEPQ